MEIQYSDRLHTLDHSIDKFNTEPYTICYNSFPDTLKLVIGEGSFRKDFFTFIGNSWENRFRIRIQPYYWKSPNLCWKFQFSGSCISSLSEKSHSNFLNFPKPIFKDRSIFHKQVQSDSESGLNKIFENPLSQKHQCLPTQNRRNLRDEIHRTLM